MFKGAWSSMFKKKNCLNCGKDLFLTGRTKYCNDKCKKEYGNKQNNTR